jgi:hypothetical protein
MAQNVTKVHLLDDIKDLASTAGFGDQLETRFARAALGSKEGALGIQRIKPGQRQPFAHKQKEQEEIHVVIAGSGRVKVDHDFIDLVQYDAIRIAPDVIRQFEAGPVPCFSGRNAADLGKAGATRLSCLVDTAVQGAYAVAASVCCRARDARSSPPKAAHTSAP